MCPGDSSPEGSPSRCRVPAGGLWLCNCGFRNRFNERIWGSEQSHPLDAAIPHRPVMATFWARHFLATVHHQGYTIGMKTAVSIPDTVFARTERFARRMKKSRSRVVSDALQEYLARHSPDEVTQAMDRALRDIEEPFDSFVASAAKRTLEQVEW